MHLARHGENGRKAPRLAFTTDSFVVRPLFFPGGDIGRLAVHGTVNDLAVGGATPLFLSAAFILEEGLPMDDLRRIVASMRQACGEAGVQLVTGDTKVVDRGKGDQIFITTSGIGLVPEGCSLSIRLRDRATGSSFPGRSAIMGSPSCRCAKGSSSKRSWRATQHRSTDLTRAMLDACPAIRCMRDPTRGGFQRSERTGGCVGVGVKLEEACSSARERSARGMRDARARPALRRQ